MTARVVSLVMPYCSRVAPSSSNSGPSIKPTVDGLRPNDAATFSVSACNERNIVDEVKYLQHEPYFYRVAPIHFVGVMAYFPVPRGPTDHAHTKRGHGSSLQTQRRKVMGWELRCVISAFDIAC